jgi:hypothetical protein
MVARTALSLHPKAKNVTVMISLAFAFVLPGLTITTFTQVGSATITAMSRSGFAAPVTRRPPLL